MADAFENANLENPCERAKVLRGIYFRLISGQIRSGSSHTGGAESRSTTWSQANIPELKEAIRVAEYECSILMGKADPRSGERFAIVGGARVWDTDI